MSTFISAFGCSFLSTAPPLSVTFSFFITTTPFRLFLPQSIEHTVGKDKLFKGRNTRKTLQVHFVSGPELNRLWLQIQLFIMFWRQAYIGLYFPLFQRDCFGGQAFAALNHVGLQLGHHFRSLCCFFPSSLLLFLCFGHDVILGYL